jgi:NCAIR mutase (PurE)-related protein
MTPQRLRALLENVRNGDQSIESALDNLRSLPFEDLDFAKVDHHRALRQGFPEVVFGAGKTPAQIAAIAEKLAQGGDIVLVTRASTAAFDAVQKIIPSATYDEAARLIQIDGNKPQLKGKAAVLCAGTSDLPVAREAALCLEAMGAEVMQISDIGVAGLHRLLETLPRLRECSALIVVAGMEGALPSVVAGLVSVPVVAVPTSIGYGASFGGLAALLGMLNSCSNGIAVVNIDNGFGAAAFVASILRTQVATDKSTDKSTDGHG